MTYKSMESQIRGIMTEGKKPRGKTNLLKEEVDAEGGMAKTQLLAICAKAKEMADSLGDEEQLEAWIQTKISLASDYIDTVHNVMIHGKDKGRVK